MTKLAETPFSATVALSGFAWGTRIDMACSYGDWGRVAGSAAEQPRHGRRRSGRQQGADRDVAGDVRCHGAAQRQHADTGRRHRLPCNWFRRTTGRCCSERTL